MSTKERSSRDRRNLRKAKNNMYQNELKRSIAEKQIRDKARALGADMTTFVLDDSELKELYLKMGGVYVERKKVEEPTVEEPKVVRGRPRKNVE